MSDKKVLVCDKCGKVFLEDEKYYITSIRCTRNVEYESEILYELHGDICEDCMKEFAIEKFKLRDEWGV